MPNEQTRAYIYRVVLALVAVALIYGVATQEQLNGWLQVVGALLGISVSGLAAANTSTKSNGV